MELKKSTSKAQIWQLGSLKLLFMLLYFTNLCSLSIGGYPAKPSFVIQNIKCSLFIHPIRNGEHVEQHTWTGVAAWSHYDFEPVSGKYGYIRNIYTRLYWHPDGGASKSRKKGTKIILNPNRVQWALWYIDQVRGLIRHIDGYYVHFKGTSCGIRDTIHLWDDHHEGSRWRFVDPDAISEEVLPYGSFELSSDWVFVFGINRPSTTHTWTMTRKTGKSNSRSQSTMFEFQWGLTASAKKWFAEVSSTVSLTAQIQRSSSSTWYSEITETNHITVPAGTSLAVWQRVFIGRQLGDRVEFQSRSYAHTSSYYVKPNVNQRTSIPGRIYYFELNDTNTDYDIHEDLSITPHEMPIDNGGIGTVNIIHEDDKQQDNTSVTPIKDNIYYELIDTNTDYEIHQDLSITPHEMPIDNGGIDAMDIIHEDDKQQDNTSVTPIKDNIYYELNDTNTDYEIHEDLSITPHEMPINNGGINAMDIIHEDDKQQDNTSVTPIKDNIYDELNYTNTDYEIHEDLSITPHEMPIDNGGIDAMNIIHEDDKQQDNTSVTPIKDNKYDN